jgi:hypothetical protein
VPSCRAIVIARKRFGSLFFLDDGTGKLLIDPRGAQTDLQPSFSEDVAWDSAPDYGIFFLDTASDPARSKNIASVQTTVCS